MNTVRCAWPVADGWLTIELSTPAPLQADDYQHVAELMETAEAFCLNERPEETR